MSHETYQGDISAETQKRDKLVAHRPCELAGGTGEGKGKLLWGIPLKPKNFRQIQLARPRLTYSCVLSPRRGGHCWTVSPFHCKCPDRVTGRKTMNWASNQLTGSIGLETQAPCIGGIHIIPESRPDCVSHQKPHRLREWCFVLFVKLVR